MRVFYFLACAIAFFSSCGNPPDNPKPANTDTTVIPEKISFFPVTAYIKGQLFDIKEKGLTPVKYTTVKDHTDSIWLKIQDLETAVKEFLFPEIDSSNLISLFTEKKFLDQTIEAYTFTYDPIKSLPDSIQLKHWDVYIDPETNKVKRVFLKKEIAGNKTLLLTWQSNKYCMLVTLNNLPDGSTVLEKEEKIVWDF